jgi:hypothetical protein
VAKVLVSVITENAAFRARQAAHAHNETRVNPPGEEFAASFVPNCDASWAQIPATNPRRSAISGNSDAAASRER